MAQKKILVMVKVTVDTELMDEFNKHWGEELLPYWDAHGAHHLGSYTNLVGGPANEIVRLFEFDDISRWFSFHLWFFRDRFEAVDEKEARPKKPTRYVTNVEERLLVSIY